ncbi:MAG TPA: hypothetical protein PLP29_17510 [Candidatus Ozemobacteraceae bacterium]|nr:hypothetical protein [Candidatus Ozemobacteraceae bacterium]
MSELYQICMDQAVAQFITLAIVGLFSGAWIYRIWSNAHLSNTPLTFIENVQVAILGPTTLIVGMIMFGYIAFPKNAEAIMDILGLKQPLDQATLLVQRGLLWMIRFFL